MDEAITATLAAAAALMERKQASENARANLLEAQRRQRNAQDDAVSAEISLHYGKAALSTAEARGLHALHCVNNLRYDCATIEQYCSEAFAQLVAASESGNEAAVISATAEYRKFNAQLDSAKLVFERHSDTLDERTAEANRLRHQVTVAQTIYVANLEKLGEANLNVEGCQMTFASYQSTAEQKRELHRAALSLSQQG